ncbi:MAG: carbohydrate-binding domain-containing protein, partial [Bacteroidaceae bacterium]|nr:carbohydrate-binding domain-containing protein [Bacteroidaceae bacterium]
MKKVAAFLTALVLTISATGQTLNVKVGSVTYQFPASQTGEMTYQAGKTLTIMGKTFSLDDIDEMTIDDSSVKDNNVDIAYDGSTAQITVAGNVAQYVDASVNKAHVTINQTNTSDVDDDEITYVMSGSSSDGSFSLDGSYKCTLQLAGLTLTNPSGAVIDIANKKRIQLSVKKETENVLTDGAGGAQKGCIYSKGQLQLQGNGTLTVTGKTAHAVKSGDYITVKNLTLNIRSAAKDGISCNKYFQMK